MRKHNNSADSYHLRLFAFVMIGSEIWPERDLVSIYFSSRGMLANSLRAIAAGWGFQLNANVTGPSSVDLVSGEFGGESIPRQSNALCLSIIPKDKRK